MAERLFLLEVLVDKVVVQKTGSLVERLNNQNDWGTGELCVTFQFLDYPHLEICEKDFASNSKQEENTETKTSFKSGKSCLFAVPTNQLDSLPEEFALNVGVLRKMPTGVLPDKLLIAQTKIELIEPLCSIIKDTCGCTTSDVPVSRTIKDCFSLMDPAGTRTIGSICVFVRVTCCGKSIVTQFQVGGETEPATLFKGNESNKVYQFTQADEGPTCHPCCPWLFQLQRMQQQGCCPEPSPPPPCCPPPRPASCSPPPCRPPPPPCRSPPPPCCPPAPCRPPPPPCRPPPPPACCPPAPCRPPPPPPCRPPPPCCDILPPPKPAVGAGGECFCCDTSTVAELPQNLYEEIGAEINGHTLTIRVKKDKKKAFEEYDEYADEMCCQSKEDVCCEPSPPCPNRSALEIRPYGVNDVAGFKTKFPQKGTQQLCYKLRGCPGEEEPVPCDKCVVSDDPDQEAFVLRIAKDRKSHLEFELKTPKKKEPEPPITMENKETQYLLSDLKVGKGKGKDKGKGKGKGNGKKK